MAKQPREKEREVKLIAVKELEFDPHNPRFSRYFREDSQPVPEIIERMIRVENVQELMGSIGEQGYFPGEPLLVAKDGGRLIVVEGNRRLAALKLLLGELDYGSKLSSIETIRAEAKERPSEVACIVFENRKDILRYLGYRHITGPKRWDSLSKARYLKQLRENFYQDIDDTDKQLRAIAKEIGSRKDYVAQILTGLAVFENALDHQFYGLQRVEEDDIDFGVLTTALSYSNISNYFGLESRTDLDAKNINQENARDVFSWMFAQDQQGDTILGESRNLRKLSAIVACDAAVNALKEGGNLDIAYLHTEGPANVFTKTLATALNKLNEAYELVPTVEQFSHENIAALEKIEERAGDIGMLVSRAMRKKKHGADDNA